MLDFSRVQNYYIACGYTDMRKQIDGLAALVQTQFDQEMDETSLYLFCGRRADQGVVLGWNGIHSAVQAPDGKTIPVAAKREESEEAYPAGIPLAHGGTVHYPDESVCSGKARNRLLKKVRVFLKKEKKTKRILPPACRINPA